MQSCGITTFRSRCDTATLHGTELIVSPKASYPATVAGGSNSEILEELKGLREDIKAGNVQSAKNQQKIKSFIEKWDSIGLPDTQVA